MIKVLFVCHGNICRSTMCKFIMKDLIDGAGMSNDFVIDSAATSNEEIGNDMYPPAKSKLREKGVPFTRHAARQICKSDYDNFDMIIGMDQYNYKNLINYYDDIDNKISMLLDRPIADPWYTDDYETTYNDLVEGCTLLLKKQGFKYDKL